MDPDRFDKQMRSCEYFHALRLVPGTWTVIRVVGRTRDSRDLAEMEPLCRKYAEITQSCEGSPTKRCVRLDYPRAGFC